MTRSTAVVWNCDAPLCAVEQICPDRYEPPNGYSGKVNQADNGGGTSGVIWFACSKDHIEAAVVEAVARQHRKDWE